MTKPYSPRSLEEADRVVRLLQARLAALQGILQDTETLGPEEAMEIHNETVQIAERILDFTDEISMLYVTGLFSPPTEEKMRRGGFIIKSAS